MQLRPLLLLALLALLPAAPAAAAPQWLAPPGVFVPVGQVAPAMVDVAFDSAGNATAVWWRTADPFAQLVAASRPAGGEFGPAVPLSGTSVTGLPQVAVDGQGNATAVWNESVNSNFRVMTAFRPAGGAFGPASPLSDAGEDATGPQLAVNAAGDAILVWHNLTTDRIEAAVRAAGGEFAPEVAIDSGVVNPHNPKVGIDSAGNAVAAWVEFQPTHDRVRATYRPAGGVFGAGTLFPAGTQDASPPDVAMSANGDAVVAWWTNPLSTAVAVIRPAGGVFPGAATTLSPPGDFASLAKVAIDAQGSAVAAWVNFTEGRVEFAPRSPGDSFGAVQTLADVEGTSLGELEAGPGGHVIAAWLEGQTGKVNAAVREPGGANFGAAAPISPGSPTLAPVDRLDNPLALGIDAAGNAIAAWMTLVFGAPQHYGAGFAGYDNAAPTLPTVQVPERGKTGSPVNVSATAGDVWGPVTTTWDFGEAGASASQSGAQASHTYRQPGTYQVTVTATDAAGFATSATRTVVLSDGIVPRISKLSIKPRRFAVGPKRTPKRARSSARAGTTVRYRLSEPARVSLRVERALPGRRAGRKCRRPTARNRRGKRCTRFVRAGLLQRAGKAGRNRVKFSGRIGRRALRPGRYRLVVRARDAAGNRSGVRRAAFAISG